MLLLGAVHLGDGVQGGAVGVGHARDGRHVGEVAGVHGLVVVAAVALGVLRVDGGRVLGGAGRRRRRGVLVVRVGVVGVRLAKLWRRGRGLVGGVRVGRGGRADVRVCGLGSAGVDES